MFFYLFIFIVPALFLSFLESSPQTEGFILYFGILLIFLIFQIRNFIAFRTAALAAGWTMSAWRVLYFSEISPYRIYAFVPKEQAMMTPVYNRKKNDFANCYRFCLSNR